MLPRRPRSDCVHPGRLESNSAMVAIMTIRGVQRVTEAPNSWNRIRGPRNVAELSGPRPRGRLKLRIISGSRVQDGLGIGDSLPPSPPPQRGTFGDPIG